MGASNPAIDEVNNFDLIRLVAAFQVMVCHTISHLGLELNPIFKFIYWFPGVPIFFTISGFLLMNSLNKNPNFKIYLTNRVLRIFPGLWGCIFTTIIFLFIVGSINFSTFFKLPFYQWLICQLTIFQFYTPPFLRTFATPNGSLWTIPVEFQFYVLLPAIFWLSKIPNRVLYVLALLSIFLISVAFSYWYRQLDPEILLAKLIHTSVLTYLQFFLMGVFAYFFFSSIKRFLINKSIFWLVMYVLYSYVAYDQLELFSFSYKPNFWGLVAYMILSILTLSLAFTRINLSDKILKGNDISYGVYLYHMPVINYIVQNNVDNYRMLATILITIIFAIISWKLIESPALKLKRRILVFRNQKSCNC